MSYSHHQKSIICDAPSNGDDPRRLISFVGGLDLTNGRWDTPNHELFATITNEHDGDFYQNNAEGISANHGPRQPWHDIHMKLEGPIAGDVLENFIERWKKQGLPKECPYFPKDEIVKNLIKNTQFPPTENESMDTSFKWTCQLFRSITSDSANIDPRNKALCFCENKKTEMTILQAYIHLIRKAQNFIYIENQYFYGSSYMWDMKLAYGTKPCCQHTIPFEIARKIVNKIRNNEKFVAYIVVPMFPEGDPKKVQFQEILYYQRKTMEMMYETVANALQEVGSTAEPTDYLFFMCPAKREKDGPHLNLLDTPENDPVAQNFRETMRSPIYVHSKMMITDDVYIIAGSANINQRSMDGTRDTEIAVGCRQDEFGLDNPFGDVRIFRQSLFTEHFVGWRKEFEDPSSPECIKKVKQLSKENWTEYIGPRGSVMKGHMLPYPIHIKKDGTLSDMLGTDGKFPDFGGKIAGKRIPLNLIKSHQKILT